MMQRCGGVWVVAPAWKYQQIRDDARVAQAGAAGRAGLAQQRAPPQQLGVGPAAVARRADDRLGEAVGAEAAAAAGVEDAQV